MNYEDEQLLILLSPISNISHYLTQVSQNPISEFEHPIAKKLRQSGIDYIKKKVDFQTTVSTISALLNEFSCHCENQDHYIDERIKIAIDYLEANVERVVPVEEIARHCYLSTSRFLHLFKKKTGITYRKIQQWNKINKSFNTLFQQSITQTAHQFGFTDSAHYSKVFKETFGFTPKQIQKS